MDDRVKIYDTVRGKQWLSSRVGYGTVSARVKKSHHWSNIFSNWKRKSKPGDELGGGGEMPSDCHPPSPGYSNGQSNIMHPSANKYCSSLSAASGNVYMMNPGHHLVAASPFPNTYMHHSVRSPKTTKRSSLFSSQWEPAHQPSDITSNHHSHHHHPNLLASCTCDSTVPAPAPAPTTGTVRSVRSTSNSSASRKTLTECLASPADSRSFYDRVSSIDYSSPSNTQLQGYNHHQQLDIVVQLNKCVQKHGDKLRKNSTCSRTFLNRYSDQSPVSSLPEPDKGPNRPRFTGGHTAGTVNERLLRALKKSSKDPFSSVASRRSILESDVSAYDLVKQRFQTPFEVDDDLSDNVLEGQLPKQTSARRFDDVMVNLAGIQQATTLPSKSSTKNISSRTNSTSNSSVHVHSSMSTQNESITSKSSDLLSSNLRLGGQGMVLFAWDKGLKQGLKQQSSNSAGVYEKFPAAAKRDMTDCNYQSIAESFSLSVPEPDYSDNEDTPSVQEKETLHYRSSASQPLPLSCITANISSHSPTVGSTLSSSSSSSSSCDGTDDNEIRLSHGGEHDEDEDCEEETETEKEESASHQPVQVTAVAVAVAAVAKSILKKPTETSSSSNNNITTLIKSLTNGIKSTASSEATVSKLDRTAKATTPTCAAAGQLTHIQQNQNAELPPIRSLFKLKQRQRAKKHVTFRAHGDDSLILEHINITEPIPEEEEPLYDDIYSPGGCQEYSSAMTAINAAAGQKTVSGPTRLGTISEYQLGM